jgi:hypothetical protein
MHTLGEPLPPSLLKAEKTKPEPPTDLDWIALHEQYVHLRTDELLSELSESLGVSQESLKRVEAGWLGRGNWTFPMRDGRENIIGLRVRGPRGKYAVRGSRNGLFIPIGVTSRGKTLLLVCEGPTDCAALLDMGFDAIGRPSCTGGVEMIKTFLSFSRREVIVMADNDSPKKGPGCLRFRPGQEGALSLAKAIKDDVRAVCVVKPPKFKDIREWYRAGATKADVMALVKNTRYL